MYNPADWTTYSTWERYVVTSNRIANLTIRDRRFIFNTIKESTQDPLIDFFIPEYGFTIGEFAVWYMLNEYTGRKHVPK